MWNRNGFGLDLRYSATSSNSPNLEQNLECDVQIVRDRELLTEAEPPEEKNDQNEDKGEWKPIK